MSETFLDATSNIDRYKIAGYNLFHHDRLGKQGGGVAIYFRDIFICKTLYVSPGPYHSAPEFCIVELLINNMKILFCVVYRPPQTSPLDEFFERLSPLLPDYHHIIITGDFNIDLTRPGPLVNLFESQVAAHSLEVVSRNPTYHLLRPDGSTYHSCLDLFITRNNDMVSDFRQSDAPFTPGHDLVMLTYNVKVPKQVTKTISARKLKLIDQGALLELLRQHLPPPPSSPPANRNNFQILDNLPPQRHLQPSSNPDLCVATISHVTLEVFNSLAPITEIKINPSRKPWVSQILLRRMRDRDKLYRRAMRGKSVSLYNEYRVMRNAITTDLGNAEAQFIRNIIESQPDSAAQWREFRKLGIVSQRYPSPLTVFDSSVLNAHYASVSQSEHASTPSELDGLLGSLPQPPAELLFEFSRVDQQIVSEVFNGYQSKGVGIDGISSTMLKLAFPALLPHITNVINSSLSGGIFPESWKHASIIPLAKTRHMTSPSDSRPIAQLCELSKLLEKVVHRQLLAHLTAHNLIDPYQSGYRKHHSAQTALLGILEDARVAAEGGKVTVLVSFDMSKAFDTIPHDKLLVKLRGIGCSDGVLEWFRSYLSNRRQAVRMENGNHTDWLLTNTGVPQGSVLGPLLFLIFINDLPGCLKYSRHAIFADDTQIYIHAPFAELSSYIRLIFKDASSIASWTTANGLNLNPDKTTVIILSSRGYRTRIKLDELPRLMLNGTSIPYSSHIKTLGIFLDSTLDWNRQVNEMSRRVHFALHSLSCFRKSLTRSVRLQLSQALVLPLFDYGSPLLTSLTMAQVNRLHCLHNACVRFVHGSIPRMSNVTPYRISIGWLSATSRREYLTTSLAFTVLRTGQPTYLSSKFIRDPGPTVLWRSSRRPRPPLIYPTAATVSYLDSFAIQSSMSINKFVDLFSPGVSSDRYKADLKRLLFQRDCTDWVSRARSLGIVPIPPTLTNLLSPILFPPRPT